MQQGMRPLIGPLWEWLDQTGCVALFLGSSMPITLFGRPSIMAAVYKSDASHLRHSIEDFFLSFLDSYHYLLSFLLSLRTSIITRKWELFFHSCWRSGYGQWQILRTSRPATSPKELFQQMCLATRQQMDTALVAPHHACPLDYVLITVLFQEARVVSLNLASNFA